MSDGELRCDTCRSLLYRADSVTEGRCVSCREGPRGPGTVERDLIADLTAENERLHAEVARLRAEVARLDTRPGSAAPPPAAHDPLRLHGGEYTTQSNSEGI